MALGGPPLVKAAVGEDVTAEEMGGSQVHTKLSGVADLEVADDRGSPWIRAWSRRTPTACGPKQAWARSRW